MAHVSFHILLPLLGGVEREWMLSPFPVRSLQRFPDFRQLGNGRVKTLDQLLVRTSALLCLLFLGALLGGLGTLLRLRSFLGLGLEDPCRLALGGQNELDRNHDMLALGFENNPSTLGSVLGASDFDNGGLAVLGNDCTADLDLIALLVRSAAALDNLERGIVLGDLIGTVLQLRSNGSFLFLVRLFFVVRFLVVIIRLFFVLVVIGLFFVLVVVLFLVVVGLFFVLVVGIVVLFLGVVVVGLFFVVVIGLDVITFVVVVVITFVVVVVLFGLVFVIILVFDLLALLLGNLSLGLGLGMLLGGLLDGLQLGHCYFLFWICLVCATRRINVLFWIAYHSVEPHIDGGNQSLNLNLNCIRVRSIVLLGMGGSGHGNFPRTNCLRFQPRLVGCKHFLRALYQTLQLIP